MALALGVATPAMAEIIPVPSSFDQGILVHADGGAADTGPVVTGNLGSGPSALHIVNFSGTTTGTPSDILRIQNGSGQADVTGAQVGNGTYNLLNGNIYLTGNAGFSYIEFGLTGNVAGFVDFLISSTLNGVVEAPSPFHLVLGEGDTHFAFNAVGGEAITNVYFAASAPTTSISLLKQVRISQTAVTSAVPEPATWAMMLLGFGAMGASLRRSRRRSGKILQIA
ncbi:PEPxxWA-CTERM sorting domain-containing protein [Tardiphaga sp.]|uniref:PEPxxWA-CTERM sorting domain-containing protein n=1 Tax=Tardiphaga sp. TaxID=1926292 RepID=UPI0025EE8EB5|nr:PEPxxWA-CTERM sorting domain-containing protein [Tardiphaga sp.]